jgi:hypothetical protein
MIMLNGPEEQGTCPLIFVFPVLTDAFICQSLLLSNISFCSKDLFSLFEISI